MMYDIVKHQKSYIHDCKCTCIFCFLMIELVERTIRSINFGSAVIGWFIKSKDYNKNKFFKLRSERHKATLYCYMVQVSVIRLCYTLCDSF